MFAVDGLYLAASKPENFGARRNWPPTSLPAIARVTYRPEIAQHVGTPCGQRLNVIDGGRWIATDPAAAVPVEELGSYLLSCKRHYCGSHLHGSSHRTVEHDPVRISSPPCGVVGFNTLTVGSNPRRASLLMPSKISCVPERSTFGSQSWVTLSPRSLRCRDSVWMRSAVTRASLTRLLAVFHDWTLPPGGDT